MILRKTLWAVAILVAGVCAAPQAAIAAEPPKARTPEAAFAVLDEDGNGQIDRAEWQTRKMAIFYIRDVDEDLQLSRSELPGLAQEPFAKADLDRDGALSGYEFNQSPFSQFERADGDGDGVVSASEFRGYMESAGTPR